MKLDFHYSTEFYRMNSPELSHTCMHLICTAGEGSFVFNERCYHLSPNDLVVMPSPDRARNLAAHPDMRVEWFAADHRFLLNLLPSNNYGIGGSITLNRNPVIPLSEQQATHILSDFHRLRDRLQFHNLLFYRELMGSLCLTMMYDIFEAHAQRDASDTQSDRAAYIVRQLMDLLATGTTRTERSVSYYAERLHVSPKYLSSTIKRLTGYSVVSYIDRYTVPLLVELLNDHRLSLTQVSELMNFSSLSYFSRYCTKHLGCSPAAYRRSLQPKG
ncbi:MAG: AraC family transcriptional regulator [Paludibacteraceae bacterium]|nr:AraC family transcriptional regulator [Paludibacteraceae bacterium]